MHAHALECACVRSRVRLTVIVRQQGKTVHLPALLHHPLDVAAVLSLERLDLAARALLPACTKGTPISQPCYSNAAACRQLATLGLATLTSAHAR